MDPTWHITVEGELLHYRPKTGRAGLLPPLLQEMRGRYCPLRILLDAIEEHAEEIVGLTSDEVCKAVAAIRYKYRGMAD